MVGVTEVRPSPIAGKWYPREPEKLARQVDAYLNSARLPDLSGEVIALVAPHAGYLYSGATAGHAFAALCGKSFTRVALLAPLHAYHPADFITTAHPAYQTPLGVVEVDRPGLAELETAMQTAGLGALARVARDQEHALEIELPFLQRALVGEFQLLPVMVRSLDARALRGLGQALAKIAAQQPTLLVASSDLSHFFPLEIANRLDEYMLHAIEQFSPEGVLAAEESGRGAACGAGGVAAVMWAARDLGANTVQVLHHSTSAEQTGEPGSVVGYGAAVFLKTHGMD